MLNIRIIPYFRRESFPGSRPLQATLLKGRGMKAWRQRVSAFTLVEVVIALGIASVGFLGAYGMVLQSGKQVSAAEENALVCSGLEQEMDLLRTLSWSSLTDGTGVTGTVWNTPAASISGLTVTRQTITISAYDVADAQTLNAVWNTGSSASVTLSPAGSPALSTANAVKIVATTTWTGRRSSRAKTASLMTVIAEGGISKSVHP